MDIKKSEFTISSATVSQCPKDTKPEFAFIGRSNVGKSSLINMLCNRKGLAKTSATPGKTLLINHFIINNEWYLVDLPGYGFAKRSKTVQKKLDQMITSYILQREQLVNEAERRQVDGSAQGPMGGAATVLHHQLGEAYRKRRGTDIH